MSETDEELLQEARELGRKAAQRIPCPNCAELESEVKRLQEAVAYAEECEMGFRHAHHATCGERDRARALLSELAAAATAYQDAVHTGELKARLEAGAELSEVLRRAEAEAGGENTNG